MRRLIRGSQPRASRRGSQQRTSRSSSATQPPAAETPANPPAAEAPNPPAKEVDRQEIVAVRPREGNVMSAELCETHIRLGHAALQRKSENEAVLALDVGNQLSPLYFGFAEQVKGFRKFAPFAAATFQITETDARDFVRFAEYFSEATARDFGKTRMRLCLRLMDAAGLSSFAGLLEHEFALRDGHTFKLADRPLPSSRDMEDAIDFIRNPPRKVSRLLLAECARKNEALVAAYEKWPVLRWAGLKYQPEDGQVVLKNKPLGPEERLALAHFILENEGR